MTFILAHPYLCSAAAIWLAFVILGWLFIAGAAIASADNDKHKPAPPRRRAELAAKIAAFRSDIFDEMVANKPFIPPEHEQTSRSAP